MDIIQRAECMKESLCEFEISKLNFTKWFIDYSCVFRCLANICLQIELKLRGLDPPSSFSVSNNFSIFYARKNGLQYNAENTDGISYNTISGVIWGSLNFQFELGLDP